MSWFTFDQEYAKEYGVNEAILIEHFSNWINNNRKNGANFYEGRTWSYDTLTALEEWLPFLTRKQIRGAIDRLVELGVLIKGNFNKTKQDRTTWYAFQDEERFAVKGKRKVPEGQMQMPQGANADAAEGTSIKGQNKPLPNPLPERAPAVLRSFEKPTLSEVQDFMLRYLCEWRPLVDKAEASTCVEKWALDFCDFYEDKQWKVGRQPMKSWRFAAQRFVRGNFDNYQKRKQSYGKQQYKFDPSEIQRDADRYNQIFGLDLTVANGS